MVRLWEYWTWRKMKYFKKLGYNTSSYLTCSFDHGM
jgi:hypothetical protein